MNRLRLLLPCLALLLCAGCASTSDERNVAGEDYRKVTVTNVRGDLIAEWIAAGGVARYGDSVRFLAVQRISAPPFVTNNRYPLGRRVTISGPHITVEPWGKPEWLYDFDRS